jgi:hypothetical protein
VPDFTYKVPDAKAFVHTLRNYLDANGQKEAAALLIGATCVISPSSSFSGRRWNAYDTSVFFQVPAANLSGFTEKVKRTICQAVDVVFPPDAGYDISVCEVSPVIESPPEDDDLLANNATLGTVTTIDHDGLRFRWRSEIRIYDELKKRSVLFFANATAVLGGKDEKREPDFLACLDGKWGILEVMGDQYHPSATAMRDHDRARLFKDYGLILIEFYPANRCYTAPETVVADFLQRLAKV